MYKTQLVLFEATMGCLFRNKTLQLGVLQSQKWYMNLGHIPRHQKELPNK